MRKLIRLALIIFAMGYHVGCNKVKFAKDPNQDPCLSSPGTCTYINGRYNWNEKVTASLGKVDILIVDDNSGSMSFEQNSMAQKFSQFVAALDAKNVDYRIGITTTDISSPSNPARGINQSGALQDGKLISFPNGKMYLENAFGSQSDRSSWFSQTIQRPETINCENFVKNNPTISSDSQSYLDNCPSGDERGIYAANLTIQNNPSGFIRPEAHLAIVILSDEDVRSSNYYKSTKYGLSSMDLPLGLIGSVNTLYPSKTLSVHSIIVKPGALQSVTQDQMNTVITGLQADPLMGYTPSQYFASSSAGDACLNQQSSQIPGAGFGGSYGYLYALLTRQTGGIEGDICAADYGSQLSNMGSSIAEQVKEVQLKCSDARDLVVTMTPSNSISYALDGATLRLSDALPTGTQISVSYTCTPN